MVKFEEGTNTSGGERQPMERVHCHRNIVETMRLKQEQEEDHYLHSHLSDRQWFHLVFVGIPIVISVWYASAILCPPGAREKAPFFYGQRVH